LHVDSKKQEHVPDYMSHGDNDYLVNMLIKTYYECFY